MVGGLLVLALLGALVAPYFIDWTAYRADFEREASAILGRKVVVKGDASARLLPFPSVTFTDVEVGGEAGQPLMTVDRFRMDAELAPYLSGEIFIYSMTLDHPKIRIPVGKDGAVRFVVDQPHIPTGAKVVLDHVGIENGTVLIEDAAAGRTQALTDVDATLSAASLAGPVDGSGSFSVDGDSVDFTVGLGVEQEDGSLPVRVEASNRTLSTKLILDGSATMTDKVPRFKGSVGIQRPVPDLVALTGGAEKKDSGSPFDALNGRLVPRGPADGQAEKPPLPPLRASGAIDLTPQAADVTDLRVEAGGGPQPYVLNGTGHLDLGRAPSFKLMLKGEQVNVDAIAKADQKAAGGAAQKLPGSALGLSDRVEAMRKVLAQIPRPTIDGTVEINLPVVTAGDTTIRNVAFAASPTGSGWALSRFDAELPGRTKVEASGTVGLDDGFSFEGDLLVASQQPSGFSDWLTGDVDPAIRSLDRAGFSAKTVLTAKRQVFNDLELDIGGDTLTGRLERAETGAHTEISARLQGGAVDLEAFFALTKVLTGQADSLANADRFDVALKAGPVKLGDAAADKIDANVLYDGDMLAIANLDVEGIAGASVTASGQLSNLKGDTKGKLDIALKSGDPQRFFSFLESRQPGIPLVDALAGRAARLAPLALRGEVEAVPGAKGKKPTLLVRFKGTANGTNIQLSSAVENGLYARTESGRFGLDLRLANGHPAVLLGQLGIPAVDLDAPGPLTGELSVSAKETGPAVVSASLRAPGSELSADGVLDVAPDGINRADLSLYMRSDDAGPWLRTTAVDLGQSFDAVPLDLSGGVVYDSGAWTLRDVSGTIDGDAVSADLTRQAGGPFKGTAHVGTLSLPWLANLVYGQPLETATAGTVWPKAPFRSSLLPHAGFDVAVSADRFDTGAAVLSGFSADLAATQSQLSLEKAKARLYGGDVSGRIALRNAGGIGGLTLQATSGGFDLAALWPGLAAKAAGSTVSGTVRLDGSGQSYRGLVSALTGAGSVTVAGAAVPGVPPALLPPLLAAADAKGFRPQGDTKTTLAALSKGKAFPVPSAKTDFSVTAGVAHFAPVTVTKGPEALTLSGSVDLAALTLDADMRLSIAPGLDRVQGAEPSIAYQLSGSLFDPALAVDATALTNYLSVRALEQEQARVEAMQESLQEKLRLRREARFYRWRLAEAERKEQARRAAEEEAQRLQAQQAAEAAAARKAAQDRAKAQAAQDQAKPEAAPSPGAAAKTSASSGDKSGGAATKGPAGGLDFNGAVPGASGPGGGEAGFQALPGVKSQAEF
ncbi:AsmA family protein [Jiella sp. M17.18]|uniref:AsmA family protein n=1 Tax=Jiella sp. M17.18 TaxID=3234247 RepID=UPI0034DE2320